jgi:hypothetical protein
MLYIFYSSNTSGLPNVVDIFDALKIDIGSLLAEDAEDAKDAEEMIMNMDNYSHGDDNDSSRKTIF